MRIAVPFLVTAMLIAGTGAARAGDQWGALAYDYGSGRYGFSYSYANKYAADSRALAECGGGCSIVLRFGNGCAAFATGPGNASGWGHAYSRGRAETIALGQCGGGCRIRVWACNG